MRRSALLILALGATVVPSVAQAHFLWATLNPSAHTVAVALQENPTDSPHPLGERVPLVKAWSKSEKTLALKDDSNWLKAPTGADCVGVSLDYGVLDKTDQGRGIFWLRYYAKASASAEASHTRVGLPVEVEMGIMEGKPVVTVLKDGKPTMGAEITAGDFIGKTGADGTVVLPATKGLIAIRALVTDKVKGKTGGKSYDLIRTYSTLTVQNDAPASGLDAEPLMKQLSESFGPNHEIVGKTAFIQTLMGGDLTKAQWEVHLQQRALIHEEIDRILRATNKPVPYGDEQKKVLELLRHDINAMGSKWPDESMAWPLTNDLLKQLRDSEKQGPYFALGVWHVYYGGITHGGRQIGAIAAKAVKVEPTYYLQSDGYRDYAKKVNEILNAEDQRQMILGGQEAYRYIIASNDVEMFKSK